MPKHAILYYRFVIIRAWGTDQIGVVFLVILIAAALASTSAALIEYALTADSRVVMEKNLPVPAARPTAPKQSMHGQVRLGIFHNSALMESLNQTALTVALPVNDIVFRFDDNPSRPYLRYSATVKVFGGYPQVRRFVDTVRKQLSETSLDAISCTRSDIRSVHVSCDLTLSAFYRRDPNA